MRDFIRDKLYTRTRGIASSDIYFRGHLVQVAKNSKYIARELNANQDVCEIAGLLHDIGYPRYFDRRKEDHILKGIRISEDLLNNLGFDLDTIEPVIDCIRTHDNHLEDKSPLENRIVHDTDFIVAMDNIKTSIELMREWGFSYLESLDRIKQDVTKKIEWINLKLFKDLAKEKKKEFDANIAHMRRLGTYYEFKKQSN